MPPYHNTLSAYLHQWVRIASGNRVSLSSDVALLGAAVHTNTGYFIFKCSECKDNWHVGHENFHGNVQDPSAETIPHVLSEWVKKHRHICKKFNNPPATNTGTCNTCKWPYGAHEESWMKPGLPMTPGVQTQIYDYNTMGSPAEGMWTNSTPAPKGMTLRQYTGRKFRDVEVEPCGLPDTNTEKTSNV